MATLYAPFTAQALGTAVETVDSGTEVDIPGLELAITAVVDTVIQFFASLWWTHDGELLRIDGEHDVDVLQARIYVVSGSDLGKSEARCSTADGGQGHLLVHAQDTLSAGATKTYRVSARVLNQTNASYGALWVSSDPRNSRLLAMGFVAEGMVC